MNENNMDKEAYRIIGGGRLKHKQSFPDSYSQLYNGKGKQRDKQDTEYREWCCYGNYKRVSRIDVEIAMTILARDYKGFGSGLIPSNMVIYEKDLGSSDERKES